MSINIYKGTVNEGFCFRDDELRMFSLRLGTLSTTFMYQGTVLQYFPTFWDQRYWKKLCHNQNLKLLKWIPDPTSALHAFANCIRDISISIVGRLFNATKQEEMQLSS